MLIPSIDLMGGRIVQLVQGEKLKLAFDDFEYWIERFSSYPLVQLIDLDAAMRQGDNSALIEQIASRLPCQVGGGIATVERAKQILAAGAQRVIFGSALSTSLLHGQCRKRSGPNNLLRASIRNKEKLRSRDGKSRPDSRHSRQCQLSIPIAEHFSTHTSIRKARCRDFLWQLPGSCAA